MLLHVIPAVIILATTTCFLTFLKCEAWISNPVITSPLRSYGDIIFSSRRIYPDDDDDDDDDLLTDDNVDDASKVEDLTMIQSSSIIKEDDSFPFRIERCQYPDLNVVADIIMDSFYGNNNLGFRKLLRLAELNRLQQNFPYVDTGLHKMLVAVVTISSQESYDDHPHHHSIIFKREVVGFVDVDARPCKPEIKLPRPYLSDLAVHPKYRRRGVAQALVEACEAFVVNIPRTELYIRVEESNEAAVQMYTQKLAYTPRGRMELTIDKKSVITLHKSFGKDKELKGDNEHRVGDDLGADDITSNDEPEFAI